jgi:integrase
MASLQQRGGWFHLQFRFEGKQYSHALKTKDRREAEAHRGTVDRVLIRIRNRELDAPPADIDLPEFLLSGGKLAEDAKPTAVSLTLIELRDRFIQTHGNGALEPKTLIMCQIHFRHLARHFGERMKVASLTTEKLQEYVVKRGEGKGKGNRKISPVTIQKDIASLRAAWNWAVRCGLLEGTFPGRYLTYPKTDEKPGFQTWTEIERKIARGGLSKTEIHDLWANLFLTRKELEEFLTFAKAKAREPHLFPMLAFAGHSGARRSELIRMRIDDVDLESGTAVIRECKKSRGRRTMRRVPISGFLKQVLKEYLAKHPGGQVMFAQVMGEAKEVKGLTQHIAYEQFRRLVRGSKWDVLKGWHVLRHSFISICAAEGVDQRVLQSWVGHLSAATHKRYTHLIPSREQQIIASVFG